METYQFLINIFAGQSKTCRSSPGSSSASESGVISTQYISGVLEKLNANQNRESTKANYLGIWRHFNKFLILIDYKPQGISWEDKTALFCAYLADAGLQSATIKSYISAIKSILKQDGYVWDDTRVLFSSLICGCKMKNDKIEIRLPIRGNLLELLLFEIKRIYSSDPQPYLEKMYIAIFCLGYYGMMRIGELVRGDHTLKAPNIHVAHNKRKMMIVLYTSKTHGKES